MDNIRPPKPVPKKSLPSAAVISDKPSTDKASRSLAIGKQRVSPKMRYIALAVLCVTLILIAIVGWYFYSLTPASSTETRSRFTVKQGETANEIADNLVQQKIIRSKDAFTLYTRLTGTRDRLQAGSYILSANSSTPDIVGHIVLGKTDEYTLTIPPGLTLVELKKVFKDYGFMESEITKAFETRYQHPLLQSLPKGASLEGYIFPETYKVEASQSLDSILRRSFDEMYKLLKDKKYLEEYAKRGLNTHQAVTLASIVQKEVANQKDQKQVAQVFLKRLAINMQLGSDVTFMYAAKQMGVTPTVGLDSPYNTRKYGGLPPGPIATMNPSALEAVAFPAAGEYLFFVAGDDGTTHYALTEDQHNKNVAAYCTKLCQ